MKTVLHSVIVLTSITLLSACGGNETASDPADSGTSSASQAATAKVDPGPPAVEDVSTKDGTVLADFTGSAGDGKRVFLQCQSCHGVEPGQNRVGPTLAGIMGQNAGAVSDYNYSLANADSGITWTPEKMFQYLEDPRRVIPGTKMAFAGLRNPQDRADVIAYLTNPE